MIVAEYRRNPRQEHAHHHVVCYRMHESWHSVIYNFIPV